VRRLLSFAARVRKLSGAALIAGYAADLLAGDPGRWHPVAGFGRVAVALERGTYAPSRLRGIAFAATLVGGVAIGSEALARAASRAGLGRDVVLAAVTWTALGGRSLRRAAERVEVCLGRGDIDGARHALRALCGRDAAELDAEQLRRAVVESLAENTSDAVVGTLLWGAVAGPAGVAAYRAANTLDAMVGSRSERYERFGWGAARLDDAMSWPAARTSAALACLGAPLVGGSSRSAWQSLRRDGGAHPSPNAGRVEAAFGGALGVRLGGPLSYDGRTERRAEIGGTRAPGPQDVRRAARLSLAVGAAAAAVCCLAHGARTRGTVR
jgi:adenosylcobinamide-phosphate synthase